MAQQVIRGIRSSYQLRIISPAGGFSPRVIGELEMKIYIGVAACLLSGGKRGDQKLVSSRLHNNQTRPGQF
jgi:hypothetical protein